MKTSTVSYVPVGSYSDYGLALQCTDSLAKLLNLDNTCTSFALQKRHDLTADGEPPPFILRIMTSY